jgi:hypothetical protein
MSQENLWTLIERGLLDEGGWLILDAKEASTSSPSYMVLFFCFHEQGLAFPFTLLL